MTLYDVVGYRMEHTMALTKSDIIDLLIQLPNNQSITPFVIRTDNVTVMGFMSNSVNEKFIDADIENIILQHIESIVNNIDNERPDGIYENNHIDITMSIQYFPDKE